jgi:hypothetical protein
VKSLSAGLLGAVEEAFQERVDELPGYVNDEERERFVEDLAAAFAKWLVAEFFHPGPQWD